MAYFRGLLVLNFVFYDQNSIEIHTAGIQRLPWRLTCMR